MQEKPKSSSKKLQIALEDERQNERDKRQEELQKKVTEDRKFKISKLIRPKNYQV